MSDILCLTFRFLHPFPEFHGRDNNGEPEWPPSPMRAFQALVNAAASRSRGRQIERPLQEVLRLLECIRPQIVTPPARVEQVGFRAYVPHNQADLVSAAWHRGNLDESIAKHRIEKDYRATLLEASEDQIPAVHYLYNLNRSEDESLAILAYILPSVRAISSLGWGIDLVAVDARILDKSDVKSLAGTRWIEASRGNQRIRVHKSGSLNSLCARHERFLSRLSNRTFQPVPPFTTFESVTYRRDDEPLDKPFAVFELRNLDGSRASYPFRQLIHIAGMTRHLAIETMRAAPPPDVDNGWVETYVAGHKIGSDTNHKQLSFLPLPSIGHPHTDPSIRRVILLAPIGDERLLTYVARRLAGLKLRPLDDEFSGKEPPILVPLDRASVDEDTVAHQYTKASRIWSSFTPVILPGHDDYKPEKRKSLIEKALRQAGFDGSCEYEASDFSKFRRSFSAHKYDKDKRPQGYIRPAYLMSQTAVHLTLRFQFEVKGPIVIGAGRHCGLGLFAPADSN